MPRVSQEERRWSYFVEIEDVEEPDMKDFERGKRLAEGLAKIRNSLLNVDDEHLNIRWSSLNRARIIVLPSFPVEREIVRSDGFYEYTSPHEISESDIPLVISHFEIVKPRLGESIPEVILINGSGPTYHTPQGGFQVQELYRSLDLLPHKVAMQKR